MFAVIVSGLCNIFLSILDLAYTSTLIVGQGYPWGMVKKVKMVATAVCYS